MLQQRDFTEQGQHKLDPVSVQKCHDSILRHNAKTTAFKEAESREFDSVSDPNVGGGGTEAVASAASRLPKNNQRREANLKKDCQDVLGFQPKRGDFDQEYDMDAELLLADMEFHEDDTPENVKLKESVIELYNARLDERVRRKKFVIERGLLDLKSV